MEPTALNVLSGEIKKLPRKCAMTENRASLASNSSESKTGISSRSRVGIILSALFVIPLAVTLFLQASYHDTSRDHEAPPELIFTSPLPPTLEVVLSQRTGEGVYARAIDRSVNARLDIMRIPGSNHPPITDLLETLKRTKAFKENPGIAPAIADLFIASVNPLRAKLGGTQVVTIGTTSVTVSRIISKDDETFYLGLFSANDAQVGFVLLDPEAKITESSLQATLGVIAPLG